MILTKRMEMDMCTEPLINKLIAYTIPIMLSGILQLLFNAADVVIVGRYASKTALAAVGSTTSLINLIVNLFMMLSIGVSVEVARGYGAHEYDEVQNTVSTAMAMSLILGLFVGLFGIIACKPILQLMGSPADVIDQSVLYLRIYFLGIPGFMSYNFGAAALRAVGDSRRPMIFLAISGVVNVILNLITVVGFRMGVAGVAIATATSQYVSAAFVLLSLIKTAGCLHLDILHLRLYKDKVLQIVKVGLPAGLQSAMFSISNVTIQSVLNTFGSTTMAAYAASNSISGFVYVSMNSVVQSATAFTGQNMGAKQFRRINRIMWSCQLIVCIIGLIMGGSAAFFGRSLIGIYAPSDPEVIEIGMRSLTIICAPYLFMGIIDVFAGVMRGMGKSLLPMLMSVLGICVLRLVWVYTVFAHYPTFEMLLISYPVSWIAATILQGTCYFILKKRMLNPLIEQTRLSPL